MRRYDRRQFLVAGAVGSAALLAGCGSDERHAGSPRDERPLKKGLASGMYGGPVGFHGDERYQYPLDSEEGRAVAALRRLRRDGKAPDRLVVQVFDFVRPPFEKGFPPGAPTHVGLFEEETGIGVEFDVTGPTTEYPRNLRNAAARNGSFDVVTFGLSELGDLAEAGLLRPLDDLVERHRPTWLDPVYGYAGGKSTVASLTRYRGRTYAVAFDMDGHPYFYRGDLVDSRRERAAFEDRHGRELRAPLTWDEQAEVAAFFTRPRAARPLYGDVSMLADWWRAINWEQRFVCSASPHLRHFNADGSANVDNEAGVRAFAEVLKSLEWNPPKPLSRDWFGQWRTLGGCSAFGGISAPTLTSVVVGAPRFDRGCGRSLRSAVSPGRVVGEALIRRPVIFWTISFGVNAFAPRARQEAAYLFLQWLTSSRMHSWFIANPSSVGIDPYREYSLEDPNVARRWQPQPTAELKDVIPRTVPPITLKGGPAYRDAVSAELRKVLTRRQTPEQAARALAHRWDRITEQQGVETQVAALKDFYRGFPTIED